MKYRRTICCTVKNWRFPKILFALNYKEKEEKHFDRKSFMCGVKILSV